jgi:hypothetical protein
MAKINYKKARKMLSKACERYIVHNKVELNKLRDESSFRSSNEFYPDVAPWWYSGFRLWLSCEFFQLLKYICHLYLSLSSYIREANKEAANEKKANPATREKTIFNEHGFSVVKIPFLENCEECKESDQRNPEVVLHNLIALTSLLNYVMAYKNKVPNFGYTIRLKVDDSVIEEKTLYMEIKNRLLQYTVKGPSGEIITGQIDQNEMEYCLHEPLTLKLVKPFFFDIIEITAKRGHTPDFNKKLAEYRAKNKSYYTCLVSDPLSVQIYTALKNFKSLVDFIEQLPNYFSGVDARHFSELCQRTRGFYVIAFESYLKGIAVQELKATLDDASLSNEEAIKKVELQLKNKTTIDLLTKNNQSQSEYILKVLSVVSILIGIGIFPTLGLAFKRLYDTGGTSINFFKPLSEDLFEDAKNITASGHWLGF